MEDHAPMVITGDDHKPVVLISLEDYKAMERTAYLLRSPKNTKRLLNAVEELENGGGVRRELIE